MRLSLVVGSVLLLTGLTTAALAYVEVRHTKIAAARERMSSLVSELASTWDSSFRRLRTQLEGLAVLPAVAEYLEGGSSSPPTGPLLAAAGQQPATLELRDQEGRLRFTTAGAGQAPLSPEAFGHVAGALDREPSTVALLASEEGATLVVAAAVRTDAGTVGSLVRRQRLELEEGGRRRWSGLFGLEASLLLGDLNSGVWTDLAGVVPAPQAEGLERLAESSVYTGRDGTRYVASSQAVPGTPLVGIVRAPLSLLLSEARASGLRLTVIALGAAALAIVAVWWIASRLTRPLEDLAAAATGIAAGDYERRVEVGRADEVGQVAAAFNAMAQSVEDSHHRLEERVAERTAELRAANEELAAFSYSVSHDLRAPLRSMAGFSQAVLEDYGERLDDAGRGYLRRIQDASGRLARLIDELLRLSRLTRAPLDRQAVDLSAIASEIAERLRAAEPGRRVSLSIEPGLRASADRALLEVALQNLLENAWKFTAGREPAEIEIGSNGDSPAPVYFVRDNGAGFDMTYADKLFTPFQRLHKPAEFAGSGIGLATVKRIVRRHGGRVWAEGSVGEGAAVHFTLGSPQEGGEGQDV